MQPDNYFTLTQKMRNAKTLEEFHVYSVLLVKWLKENSKNK